ncbi:Dimerisation domain-containing protein [Geodermatophilus telluris]|uniref:Dimerisation domain-containing protein n=1 Tax=Geodermatophilus telluris TaxID=1190417 RepID=A0A1G6RMC8_9ACTN|nr:methyltransferase [Geodermatophilus telluris]SDD05563.1 Dimerisation domain-containing protein [Geodermatophilus telluris]
MSGSAADRLARQADGYLVTQLLHTAVVLGVPDALAGGPRDAVDLAGELGARPGPLHRVLRGLAAEEVLAETGDGRFALTDTGRLLCAGVPGSLRDWVATRGGLYFGAAAGLPAAVRDGSTPYETVHGLPFFAHLSADPARLATFQAAMADRSAREAGAVVAAYDAGGFSSVVDVGGGRGTLLRAVRERAPGADVVLFDLPEVVAGSDLPAAGGDFFTAVPAGADAYLLSRVLHDWDDGDALRVLRTCRAAMRPDSVLLVVEAVLPERAADDAAAVRMDLHMLLLLHGCERTATEYAALCAAAGLRLTRDVPTDAGVHVLEARPA